eukprot:m.374740 g.374740  ORF g.374740 m.374740 type:complete len:76 (+) comp74658_c0_seq1:42-269(+)
MTRVCFGASFAVYGPCCYWAFICCVYVTCSSQNILATKLATPHETGQLIVNWYTVISSRDVISSTGVYLSFNFEP